MEWLDIRLISGVLMGLALGIIANLLTPLVPVTWSKLAALRRRGYHAQLKQEIVVLERTLNSLLLRKQGSDKDLLLYALRWILGIVAVFAVGVALSFLTLIGTDASHQVRQNLFNVSVACYVAAVVLSVITLDNLSDLTEAGYAKRTAKLQKKIARLNSRLPRRDE